jgi:hypothetical protein
MTDPAAAPLNDTKSWYASRTVWGGILAIAVPVAATLLHVNVTDVDTQQIAALLAGAGGLVGGAIAVYGRIKASKTIGIK